MKIYFNLIYNLIFVILILIAPKIFSQDTFSIVAVDILTGEIGSAGASCVGGGVGASILSDVIEGIGAFILRHTTWPQKTS